MNPTISKETITPERARELIERNGIDIGVFSARPREQIRAYATDMASLRWRINGDAIIFDADGRLINGRKRLLAASTYGVSFPTLIVEGVDPAAADHIDQHKRRSSKDVLHIAGHEDSSSLAATAATIVDIARHGLPSQQVLSSGNLLRLVEDNPDIKDARREIAGHAMLPYFSPSDLAALLYLTRRIDTDASKKFFDGVVNALENPVEKSKDVVQVLASALEGVRQEIESGGQAGSSKTRYMQVVYFTKAWNAYRTGTTLRRLRFDNREIREGGAPHLHGLDPTTYEDYITRLDPGQAPNNLIDEYRSATEDDQIVARFETITPEQAAELLFVNGPLRNGEGRNRAPSKSNLAGLARDMLAGRWVVTGQAIVISRTGRMLNGQHRLQSSSRSGVPITTLVVRGVEDDVFDTFDVAHQHTLSNILTGRGETYATTIQGALRWIWNYRESGLTTASLKPTLSELLDLFEQYPQVREYAAAARSTLYRPFKLPPSLMNALMVIFNEIDPVHTPEFFDKLGSGASMDAGHPVLKLRNKLIGLVGERRLEVKALPRIYLVCMAWNAFRTGKNVVFPKSVFDLKPPAPFDKGAAPIARAADRTLPEGGRRRIEPLDESDGWIAAPGS